MLNSKCGLQIPNRTSKPCKKVPLQIVTVKERALYLWWCQPHFQHCIEVSNETLQMRGERINCFFLAHRGDIPLQDSRQNYHLIGSHVVHRQVLAQLGAIENEC